MDFKRKDKQIQMTTPLVDAPQDLEGGGGEGFVNPAIEAALSSRHS